MQCTTDPVPLKATGCVLFHCRSNRTGYFKVPSCGHRQTLLSNMPSARLFRIIVPVSSIEKAAAYLHCLARQPAQRISPGRHYFGCGQCILACFDPRADGDPWEAKPNPEHLYFAVSMILRSTSDERANNRPVPYPGRLKNSLGEKEVSTAAIRSGTSSASLISRQPSPETRSS